MPNVGNRTIQAIETVGGSTFKNWVNVKANDGTWKDAKKVFVHNGSGWTEVWNNRPVTTTGAGSSSAYNEITVTGTVDPNNFVATPRFYYKTSSESTYTADTILTDISGDGAQSVGNRTIIGLVENTTYNYYLSATNAAGTSDISVGSVTTPYDCRLDANGVPIGPGWSSSSVTTYNNSCGTCGLRDTTVTTYTKAGCGNSPSVVTTNTACIEQSCGCATANTNGWSATQTRYRFVGCAGCGQQQYQNYITKSGCSEVVTQDWTNTGPCGQWDPNAAGYDCYLADIVHDSYGVIGTGYFKQNLFAGGFWRYSDNSCNTLYPSCGGSGEYASGIYYCSVTNKYKVRWEEISCIPY